MHAQNLAVLFEQTYKDAMVSSKTYPFIEREVRPLKNQAEAHKKGMRQVQGHKNVRFMEFQFYNGNEKIIRDVVKNLKRANERY